LIKILHTLSKIGRANLKYFYNCRTGSLDVQERILFDKERKTTQQSKVFYSNVKIVPTEVNEVTIYRTRMLELDFNQNLENPLE
jgi:hypothetical protein